MTHTSNRALSEVAARDIRCKACNILLAKVDASGVTILRNDLQATFAGEFHASFVCDRPRCRALNVLTFPAANPERAA